MYIFTPIIIYGTSQYSQHSLTFGRSLIRISAQRPDNLTEVFITFLSSFSKIFTIGQDLSFLRPFQSLIPNNPTIQGISYAVEEALLNNPKGAYLFIFIHSFAYSIMRNIFLCTDYVMLLRSWSHGAYNEVEINLQGKSRKSYRMAEESPQKRLNCDLTGDGRTW